MGYLVIARSAKDTWKVSIEGFENDYYHHLKQQNTIFWFIVDLGTLPIFFNLGHNKYKLLCTSQLQEQGNIVACHLTLLQN